jgi:hypothetical protein
MRQGLPGGSLATSYLNTAVSRPSLHDASGRFKSRLEKCQTYFGDPRTPVELAKLGKHVEWEETNKGQTALRSNDEKTNLEGKLE